jgi:mannosyltransferase
MIKRTTNVPASIDNRLMSQYQYWLLAAITLGAFVLRFYKLGEWSFWIDEIFTIDRAKEIGPLNRLPSVSLITTSSVLRTALIGILTIPILYFPIKKLFGQTTALLAILFLAISPWHIYWSQNARFYTALLIFYCLGLFLYYLGTELDNIWYVILAVFLFVLAERERNLLAMFYLPILFSFLALVRLFRLEKSADSKLRFLILLLVPIVVAVIFDVRTFAASSTTTGINQNELIQTTALGSFFFQFIGNESKVNPFWLLAEIVNDIGIPVVCLGFFAGISLLIKKNRKGIFIFVSAVIPLILILAITPFSFTVPRYLFITLPSWAILAAIAIQELFEQVSEYGKILAGGILLTLISVSVFQDIQYFKYEKGYRHDHKAAYAYIQQNRRDDDLVASNFPEIGEFYLGEPVIERGEFDSNPEKYIQVGRRIWFEDSNWGPPDDQEWLRAHSELIAVFDVSTPLRTLLLRLYLYDPAKQ